MVSYYNSFFLVLIAKEYILLHLGLYSMWRERSTSWPVFGPWAIMWSFWYILVPGKTFTILQMSGCITVIHICLFCSFFSFIPCLLSVSPTAQTHRWETQPSFTGTSSELTNQVQREWSSLFSSMQSSSCFPSPSSSSTCSGQTCRKAGTENKSDNLVKLVNKLHVGSMTSNIFIFQ